MPSSVIAEIADRIAARQRVYRSAYTADLDRLRREHGISAVNDALALLKQPTRPCDQRAAVARAVARVVAVERCWPLE